MIAAIDRPEERRAAATPGCSVCQGEGWFWTRSGWPGDCPRCFPPEQHTSALPTAQQLQERVERERQQAREAMLRLKRQRFFEMLPRMRKRMTNNEIERVARAMSVDDYVEVRHAQHQPPASAPDAGRCAQP